MAPGTLAVVSSTGTGLSAEALDALDRAVDGLPEGVRREGQDAMCEAVAEAVAHDHHVVVQAGTGTGKTLAYLVPALLSGRRTVVATATKALQDQLAHKDLPHLAEHLERPFTHAVLKGRANYLCLQRLDEASRDDQLGFEGMETLPEQAVTALSVWTESTETGDRADLPEEPLGGSGTRSA